MNERIQLLIDALRSGEYLQARRELRMNDNFCCLGVACDIYRKATGNGEWVKSIFSDDESAHYSFLGERGAMPNVVADWFGVVETNPSYDPAPDDIGERSLASDNDSGASFAEIAHTLEKHFLNVGEEGDVKKV